MSTFTSTFLSNLGALAHSQHVAIHLQSSLQESVQQYTNSGAKIKYLESIKQLPGVRSNPTKVASVFNSLYASSPEFVCQYWLSHQASLRSAHIFAQLVYVQRMAFYPSCAPTFTDKDLAIETARNSCLSPEDVKRSEVEKFPAITSISDLIRAVHAQEMTCLTGIKFSETRRTWAEEVEDILGYGLTVESARADVATQHNPTPDEALEIPNGAQDIQPLTVPLPDEELMEIMSQITDAGSHYELTDAPPVARSEIHSDFSFEILERPSTTP